jgi:hypothetical protein
VFSPRPGYDLAVLELRPYRHRQERPGHLPGLLASAGLFPDQAGKLLRLCKKTPRLPAAAFFIWFTPRRARPRAPWLPPPAPAGAAGGRCARG